VGLMISLNRSFVTEDILPPLKERHEGNKHR